MVGVAALCVSRIQRLIPSEPGKVWQKGGEEERKDFSRGKNWEQMEQNIRVMYAWKIYSPDNDSASPAFSLFLFSKSERGF